MQTISQAQILGPIKIYLEITELEKILVKAPSEKSSWAYISLQKKK
jgi:hypothetical protein